MNDSIILDKKYKNILFYELKYPIILKSVVINYAECFYHWSPVMKNSIININHNTVKVLKV